MNVRIPQRGTPGFVKLIAGVCVAAFWLGSAQAQVMEVRSDGTTAVYAGPVVTTALGIRSLAPVHVLPYAGRVSPGMANLIRDASSRHRLSPQLVEAVAWQESRLRQNAVSPKGARGVMQLMPATARALNVDASDLRANLDGGAAYLSNLMRQFDNNLVAALAAYNAGPAAVIRFGGVPPIAETRAYVDAVLDRMAAKAQSPTESHP